MSTSLSKLKNLPFWQNLSLSEQEIMSNCVQIRRYQKDELIYSHDHECLGLIKVLSGEIRTFMLSDEGREIVLYRLKAGDTDVLSASCVVNQITFETQMVAESDCEILIIPAVCLSNFKENNLYVRCFIFEKLGERFSDVMSQMQKILFTPVEVRLSGSIREHLKQCKGSEITVTHEQLAGEINSSREVVSRILKRMEHEGSIILGRGKITVTNTAHLRNI